MLNQINFQTVQGDIYDAAGNRIDPNLGQGIYREDTGELLAIGGRNHKTVDHMQIVGPVLDHFESQGYEIEERAPSSGNDLYDLKGKKGVWLNTSVEKNGAVMRCDLICGDFIDPTSGTGHFGLRKGDDTMFNRITLLNSHDGTLAIHANTSYMRLVCLNGMVDASWSVNTRAKHTTGLRVEGLKERIRNSLRGMGDDADRFALYAKTRVTKQQAAEFFQQTIAKLANKSDGSDHWSEPLVRELLTLFDREDPTVWGVWNAMTAWATHGQRRAGASLLGTTLNREQRVAAAMRTPRFDALLAA